MRIEYKPPSIIDKLDAAITEAQTNNQRIDNIRLSAQELKEFCDITGMAYSKQCRYTYKHLIIAYDWGEFE